MIDSKEREARIVKFAASIFNQLPYVNSNVYLLILSNLTVINARPFKDAAAIFNVEESEFSRKISKLKSWGFVSGTYGNYELEDVEYVMHQTLETSSYNLTDEEKTDKFKLAHAWLLTTINSKGI